MLKRKVVRVKTHRHTRAYMQQQRGEDDSGTLKEMIASVECVLCGKHPMRPFTLFQLNLRTLSRRFSGAG